MIQSGSKNNWRLQWITAILVLLFAGLLLSRAIVSFASALAVVPFLGSKERIKPAYLLAIALLLLPVTISFFWSEDKGNWWNSVSIKLPLLTMMMGACAVPVPAKRQKQVVWLLLLIVAAGCCWSLAQYSTALQEAYLRAKTLPTAMDNDHIRFSWLVVVAVLLGLRVAIAEKNKPAKALIVALIVFLVAYLHILAAKTGLVCLYGGALFYLLYTLFISRNWKTAIVIVCAMGALAMAFYYTAPTLRNRIRYVRYDVENFTKGNSMPGYNDAARWLSIRAGYGIMQQHPILGVGAGDLHAAVNSWHETHHPQSLLYERFLPANEWIVYGAAAGWPGLILFSAGLLLLLFVTTSQNVWSWTLSIITLVPFLVDDTLEGQYGVVILAFIAFFGQRILRNDRGREKDERTGS